MQEPEATTAGSDTVTEENHENPDSKINDSENNTDDTEVKNALEDDADDETDSYKSADEGDDEEDKDEDEFDEEFLKERDAGMTEDEKQNAKEEAQKLKANGNNLFKESKFSEAVKTYQEALSICPLCYAKERSIMYSNRAACRLHLEQYELAIKDCTKAVELNPQYLKALLRRAELNEKTEKLEDALKDYQKVLEMDPSQHSAREACLRLPDQINERNEKLKTEMLGKLKELGNMVLKPFGLSTENFKLNQDPNSGGYSVSFQQSNK